MVVKSSENIAPNEVPTAPNVPAVGRIFSQTRVGTAPIVMGGACDWEASIIASLQSITWSRHFRRIEPKTAQHIRSVAVRAQVAMMIMMPGPV